MQQRVGTLGAIQQLETRTDEQLQSESKHRAAARRSSAPARPSATTPRPLARYFNEALAGAIRRSGRRCAR